MKLNDWMKANEISVTELAKKLGHSRTDSIQRWLNGECFPQGRHRKRLYQITEGQVTPADLIQ